MNQDDPIRAIFMVTGATVLFATADTISKYLTASMPVVEILWIRYVLFLVMALALNRGRRFKALTPANPKLQIARGIAVIVSSMMFVYGVRTLSMADATSIAFLSPMLITILSIPLLGETVGPRRWAAVGAGMVGVLIVVRPGLSGFQPAALFGIGGAFCWALALIVTRKIANTDAAQTTVLWSAAIGTLVLTALLPLGAVWPTPFDLLLALVLGVLASAGQWLVILAHRYAPASLIAPFSYTQLLWSTFWGWAVFANLPDHWTMAGATLIVASGLYTAHRERIRSRQKIAKPATAV
jgi:drug/metabolite transporter (DMT)-like permease